MCVVPPARVKSRGLARCDRRVGATGGAAPTLVVLAALAQPSQASTLSGLSATHFAAASSGDILSAVM